MASVRTKTKDDPSAPGQQEAAVRALIDTAQRQGTPDAYVGKRRWTRYRIGMPLEVALDPSVPGGSWRVITHNVSRGGLGFWSKQALSPDEEIYVREWSEEAPGSWLTAHVTYSVLGINGYLVGVSFKYPDRQDAPFDVRRYDPPSPGRKCKRRLRLFSGRISLRRHYAYTAAGASLLAVTVAGLMHPYAEAAPGGNWLQVMNLGLAGVLGGAVGWLAIGRESRALAQIQSAIEHLAAGAPSNVPLPESRIGEAAALRVATLELGRLWRQHGEAERLQRERLEEISQIKSNMLSMVSHDLRTPLTSIQMYAEMLNEDLTTMAEQDQHHFLGVISEECMRLSRLVDDLLAVQRVEAGRVEWEIEPHDLAETVRSVGRVFEPIAARNNIRFHVSCPETLPHILAHPDKMSQVLNNLLSNAVKLSPEGGEVRLSAEARNAEILIRVSDTGPGIPRDKWDDVFDRFVQLPAANAEKASGVGLGLFIARQIVELHGGRIWLNSELGRGTEFSIGLPLEPKQGRPGTRSQTEEPAGRIVICDADPALAAMMVQVLREGNLDVHVAHTGRKLLQHIADTKPDAVITDVALPDMKAVDLFDALGELKQNDFALVVHAVDGTFDDLRNYGVHMLLPRPTSPDELLQAARIAVFKKHGEGSVVLVVSGWGLDCDPLCQHLAARNHLPLIASDVPAALRMIQERAFDIVVTKVGAEGSLSRSMDLLTEALGGEAHVFALSNLMSPLECQNESTEHVTYVPYIRGEEEAVATVITEFILARTAEPIS